MCVRLSESVCELWNAGNLLAWSEASRKRKQPVHHAVDIFSSCRSGVSASGEKKNFSAIIHHINV